MHFDDQGLLRVTRDGRGMVESQYEVKNDQLEFRDETGPWAMEGSQPGRYRWLMKDGALHLEKIQDTNRGRAEALTSKPWTFKHKRPLRSERKSDETETRPADDLPRRR